MAQKNVCGLPRILLIQKEIRTLEHFVVKLLHMISERLSKIWIIWAQYFIKKINAKTVIMYQFVLRINGGVQEF